MARFLSCVLAAIALVASASLGDNFRVASYSPVGGITYAWESDGSLVTYTIRRNGVIVRQSVGVNPNDGPVYYGDSYQATLQVDSGPESAPITVAMPAPPVALAGGELLWIPLSFADYPHPAVDTVDIATRVNWITNVSGGRTPVSLTLQPYTAGPLANYCVGGVMDVEKIKAEITAALGLQTRVGLFRVALDGDGLPGCIEGWAFPMNSGAPMWPGSTVIAPQIRPFIFLHETFHTFGLWHFGFIPGAPSNPDDLSEFGSLGGYGGEIMGSGDMHHGLSIVHLLQLGWRDPSQMQRITSTTTLTLNNAITTSTGVQGAYIQLSPAGAGYVIDYRDTVHVSFRGNRYIDGGGNRQDGFSAAQVGAAVGNGGRIFTDSARGIAVDVLSVTATTATVKITLPGPPPPPPPVVTVTITSPADGTIVAPKASLVVSATANPAGPIAWSATCGTFSTGKWTAPASPNKSCRLTASSGGGSASVTVRTSGK